MNERKEKTTTNTFITQGTVKFGLDFVNTYYYYLYIVSDGCLSENEASNPFIHLLSNTYILIKKALNLPINHRTKK